MRKPSRRIAIIDDDRCFLDFLTIFLARLGYETATYSAPLRPEHIDELLQADLILSDLFMPNFDGIEVLRSALQQDHARPVVLMTGSTPDTAALFERMTTTLGARFFIAKTNIYDHLAALLNVLVGLPATQSCFGEKS